MSYFLRIGNETMQEAINSHYYKSGYQSIEHAESQVELSESYQIYREVYKDGPIDMDAENQFETANGREFQLVKSGIK